MNLKIVKWTSKDYSEFINFLNSLIDEEYQKFTSKLIFTKYKILGIRLPILRKISKEIFSGDYKSFLNLVKDDSFEEIFIEGCIVSNILDEDEFKKYFEYHINKIDNWSLCDSFCNSLKIVKKNKEKYFEYFKSLINSNEEFKIRTMLIVFLSFYIDNNYIDDIIDLILNLNNHEYYVEMAVAWVLCEIYLKDKQKVINLLKSKKLSKFINNKTISKIRDSYRVSKEDKDYLLNWRVK